MPNTRMTTRMLARHTSAIVTLSPWQNGPVPGSLVSRFSNA